MIREFEGKTENDAINNAVIALGIGRDEIEIEIVENKKPLFFLSKGKVKIRVNVLEQKKYQNSKKENDIIDFVSNILKLMAIPAQIKIKNKDEKCIVVDILSKDSALLIGKKGKMLDALQLLTNIIASKKEEDYIKVIIDTENYRNRREKNLISFARHVAEKVKRTRSSMLLEAMNPFERRLVHTALNKHRDIETISEGEGLYKKIRVLYKGHR